MKDYTVLRVQWFRARAERDRWREEVEILEAERRRIEKSHRRLAENWNILAKRHGCDSARPQRHPGVAAYAYRQAKTVHERLAEHCVKEWDKTEVKIRKEALKWVCY